MTCYCGRPAPHRLVDDDGAHPVCGYCLIQLLADVERVGTRLTLSVEPAPAAVR